MTCALETCTRPAAPGSRWCSPKCEGHAARRWAGLLLAVGRGVAERVADAQRRGYDTARAPVTRTPVQAPPEENT